MSISRLQRSIQGTLGRQLHGCLSAGATQFPKARSCLLRPAARPTRVNEGEQRMNRGMVRYRWKGQKKES